MQPEKTTTDPLDLLKKLWHQDAAVDAGIYPVSDSTILSEEEERFWNEGVRARAR